MATKQELLDFCAANGIAADDSMLKAEIEDAVRDAGYDPNTLEEQQQEEPVADETQQTSSEGQQGGAQTQEAPPEGLTAVASFASVPDANPEEVFDPDEAREKGWWGTRPMRHPDEEYTLTTGPDAPHGELGAE